jgi:hypothetical protein
MITTKLGILAAACAVALSACSDKSPTTAPEAAPTAAAPATAPTAAARLLHADRAFHQCRVPGKLQQNVWTPAGHRLTASRHSMMVTEINTG